MKKILSLTTLLILAVSMISYVPRAKACSCIPPEPPLEAMAKADVVFAGRVTDVKEPAIMTSTLDQNKITFEAHAAWKGVDSNPVYIYSSGSSASCGYEFEEGKEYLVYAFEDEGRLATGLCTRTALLADASEDLAVLGVGEAISENSGRDDDMVFTVGGVILLIVLAGAYYYSLGRNKKNRSILGNK